MSSAPFIRLHSSLSSSVIKASVMSPPQVLPAPTSTPSSTVSLSAQIEQVFLAGAGQHVSCAPFISDHSSVGSSKVKASVSKLPQVSPRPKFTPSLTASPSAQKEQGSSMGAGQQISPEHGTPPQSENHSAVKHLTPSIPT